MLQVKQFVFNHFGENTYIVFDPDSRKAIVVDPGMITVAEQRTLDTFIAEQKLNVRTVVNTHLHLDHSFGDNYVRQKYNVLISAHPEDAFLGNSLPEQARSFGLAQPQLAPVAVDQQITHGDTIVLGNNRIEVIHVPGHSPGSVVLYAPESHFAIVGDVIFRGGIGRTDLPGGNYRQLIDGIKSRILSLPDDTILYPGHDMPTTVGQEKKFNPFLK